MNTRREFLTKTATGGIAGIIASGVTPAYAKYMNREKSIVSITAKPKIFNPFFIHFLLSH